MAALAHYPHPLDPAFVTRVRYFGVSFGIAGLYFGQATGQSNYLTGSSAALERIFGSHDE